VRVRTPITAAHANVAYRSLRALGLPPSAALGLAAPNPASSDAAGPGFEAVQLSTLLARPWPRRAPSSAGLTRELNALLADDEVRSGWRGRKAASPIPGRPKLHRGYRPRGQRWSKWCTRSSEGEITEGRHSGMHSMISVLAGFGSRSAPFCPSSPLGASIRAGRITLVHSAVRPAAQKNKKSNDIRSPLFG